MHASILYLVRFFFCALKTSVFHKLKNYVGLDVVWYILLISRLTTSFFSEIYSIHDYVQISRCSKVFCEKHSEKALVSVSLQVVRKHPNSKNFGKQNSCGKCYISCIYLCI